MKKTIFLFFLLLPAFVFSQSEKSLHIGVRGGLNLSHLWGKSIFAFQIKPSFNVSAFVHYDFHKFLGFETGVNFTRMGASLGMVTFTDENGNEILTRRVNCYYEYMQVPLTLTFKLPGIAPSMNHIYIGVGPVFGYMIVNGLNPKIDIGQGHYFMEDLVQNLQKFDVGAEVNIKPSFRVKRLVIEPEIGYYLGFLQNHQIFRHRNGSLYLRLGLGYVLK